MTLEKFALILASCAIGVGVLLWLGAFFIAAIEVPLLGLFLVPLGLVSLILIKVIAQRVGNAEEDHYDRIEH